MNRRGKMKKILYSKQMPAIVGTAAVLIFFIWGYIEGTFEHSWLIFIAAQLAVFVALAFRGDGSENTAAEEF